VCAGNSRAAAVPAAPVHGAAIRVASGRLAASEAAITITAGIP